MEREGCIVYDTAARRIKSLETGKERGGGLGVGGGTEKRAEGNKFQKCPFKVSAVESVSF